eukprot:2210036-Pleurochrysis_carterae.AAC.1
MAPLVSAGRFFSAAILSNQRLRCRAGRVAAHWAIGVCLGGARVRRLLGRASALGRASSACDSALLSSLAAEAHGLCAAQLAG